MRNFYQPQSTHDLIKLRSDHAAIEREFAEVKRQYYLRKYSDAQPRVAAGNPTGGQWVGTGRVLARALAFVPHPAARGVSIALQAGLTAYEAWSELNGPGSRAVAEFNASELAQDKSGALALAGVRSLTEEEVRAACPRLAQVQGITDSAADLARLERGAMSPQAYGTAVHSRVRDQVRLVGDPDFIAERSYTKDGATVNYGQIGSVRVDVLERVDNSTVCIYDIKTGRANFTPGRMAELGNSVYKNYGKIHRVILTEIRPSR